MSSREKFTEQQEDEAEARLREIAQNGNDGLHYKKDSTMTSDSYYSHTLEFVDGELSKSYFTPNSNSTGEFGIDQNSYDGLLQTHGVNETKEDKFGTILDSIKSLLDYKNEKYGNQALNPLGIFAEFGSIGQRIDDKLSRVKNSDELRKNDVVDLIGYLVLLCKDYGWEDFSEFKD